MKAVVVHAYGDVSELRYEEANVPALGADQVRVKMRATSINPLDWKMRSGAAEEQFPIHFPGILGVDIAGDVEESGPGVDGFAKGIRVMAMANGTYAQYAVAKADALVPIPAGLSFAQAAALPLVLTTGAQLIERAAMVQSGQTILITGAVGSVGRVAVHIARLRGAHVIAGVRASQLEEAETLGAAQVIALDGPVGLALPHNLDVVADTVGGSVQEQVLKMLRDGGVYASLVGPPKQEPGRGIQVRAMLAEPDASRLYELAEQVASGALVIPIAETFPLDRIQQATQLAEEGGVKGKVVLIIP